MKLVAVWLGCDNTPICVYVRELPTLKRFRYPAMICLN